jgi:hypothetical protein
LIRGHDGPVDFSAGPFCIPECIPARPLSDLLESLFSRDVNSLDPTVRPQGIEHDRISQ